MKKVNLTEKKEKFIFAYARQEHKNATAAARQAGYSEKTAKQKASALLKDEVVASCVRVCEQFMREQKCENEVNSDFVLQKRIKILESCLQVVPKKVWDYEKREYTDNGKVIVDPRAACMVLSDIEKSLPEESADKHSQEVLDKLFEILSK